MYQGWIWGGKCNKYKNMNAVATRKQRKLWMQLAETTVICPLDQVEVKIPSKWTLHKDKLNKQELRTWENLAQSIAQAWAKVQGALRTQTVAWLLTLNMDNRRARSSLKTPLKTRRKMNKLREIKPKIKQLIIDSSLMNGVIHQKDQRTKLKLILMKRAKIRGKA